MKIPCLLDRLGERGWRSVIINQPACYPARPIPGILIAGFVAPRLDRAVYPPELAGELAVDGYATDADVAHADTNPAAFFDHLNTLLDKRFAWFERLFRREKFSFFEAIVTETDRLQHFYIDAVLDSGHPHHSAVVDFYRKLDQRIGAFHRMYRERFGPAHDQARSRFLMMSDHGFTPIIQEVYLNALLESWGWLALRDSSNTEDSLESRGPRSRAFCLDPGRVFLNDRRFPQPAFRNPEEKEKALGELTSRLLDLRWEGRPVIEEIHRREDLYPGPELPRAADLILQPHRGFDLKGALGKPSPFGRSRLTGMHTHDDAFFYDSNGESVDSITEITGRIERGLVGDSH